ncbi:hypothetical protein [uncultured Dysosmobacter sp.]|uniref:hypothetical protein n=1 Tax=uncultured Dysosmobacter sp. TaxID=2591384 RepID=UPI0026227BB3|nr:hypothetical protein [uncultured Dysosmobacter sp.]
MDEKEKVVNVFPAIIERNRQRVCTCKNAVYRLDVKNHIVQCDGCGAVLDPFTALLDFAERWEEIKKMERSSRERMAVFNEEARKAMRFRGVQDITRRYKNGMFPICPKCGEAFDPSTVIRFVNKAYVEGEKANG